MKKLIITALSKKSPGSLTAR